MVVNGVLPIDQLREVQGPAGLVAQRIPKYYLEAIYGIDIKTRNVEGELVARVPTASEFLCAYAIARGYKKSSQGNPDESRAARYILKDYVGGKLLYIHPPPGSDGREFNREIYENEVLLQRQIKKVNMAALQSKLASETTEKSKVHFANSSL
jgi:large subunit GTPase 1